MNRLKDYRIKANLTQIQAAQFLHISRRSYQMFESLNDESSNKYQYYCDRLASITYIDEETGILTFEQIQDIVINILKDKDVQCCYLFGSYAKGCATNKSDVDLLIDTPITGIYYFGLIEELRQALHKVVDCLNVDQLVNNKVLLQEILKDGIKIY